MSWIATEGSPHPLGATWIAGECAFNFAVHSRCTQSLTLCFYGASDQTRSLLEVRLDPLFHKTGDRWHCRISQKTLCEARYYSFHCAPDTGSTGQGEPVDGQKELLDPYARELFFPAAFDLRSGCGSGSNTGSAALAVLPSSDPEPFDWGEGTKPSHDGDLLIYELHIRGFTQHPSSGVTDCRRGTYLGVIEKIPYLRQLGVTCVELMPVFAFDPKGGNYWGYMPMSFFAPHCAYASNPADAVREFKQMVKALHKAGIEVVLDVVFNHTAERGADGPTFCFKGLDNYGYYLTSGSIPGTYIDLSGTGNTLNAAFSATRQLILDSLRYWVSEMHVDGFRFDLASILARNSDGSLNLENPAIFEEIAADPLLSDVRLIGEPWDASDGYLLGQAFPGANWMQWNGRYRDSLKRFVRGEADLVGEVMTRLYGSDDLFPGDQVRARHPYQSINYIVSHDGFTLYDTVAYDCKHNLANGELNQDGPSENFSWNCGYEGDVGVPVEVLKLRKRQVRNFLTLLMLSNGTPMIRMGDELLHTQGGNSNPWNQDNETSWLNWERQSEECEIRHFLQLLISFRNRHPCFGRSRFWRDQVAWYGPNGSVDFSPESRAVAFTLACSPAEMADMLVLINMHWEPQYFSIESLYPWIRVIDTSLEQPFHISSDNHKITLPTTIQVLGRSVVVAIRSTEA